MNENKEISALLQLIDDPDQEVFETVAEKIVRYGKGIIPNLEHLWENTPDEAVQERIELLIHRLHYYDLREDLHIWTRGDEPDLLQGAMLVARYQFPDLQSASLLGHLNKIKRNIWLELNNYLTPLEQVNVLNSIIYNYFGMKGSEVSYQHPNQFFINQVMESRKGNPITIGILYQILCSMLDIPIHAVNVPRQYIMGYFEAGTAENPQLGKLQFYIDPMQGQIFTQKDIDTYLKRISVPPVPSYFRPISPRRIIRNLLEELAKCFRSEKENFRFGELMNLSSILEDRKPA